MKGLLTAAGLRIVAPEENAALLDAAVKEQLFGDDTWLEVVRSSGATLVALGPDAVVQRGAIRRGQGRPAAWWTRGERLFVAPGLACHPELWCEVEATPDGLSGAITALASSDGELKSFHFFFGLIDGVDDFRGLENRLTLDPFCEGLPLVLGTAAPGDGRGDCFDDPVHVSQFELVRSRSRVAVAAMHQMLEAASVVAGVVEYHPAPHADVVRRFNQAHQSGWPLDLPLDVLAAVGFCRGASLELIESWLVAGEPPVDAGTAVLFGASLFLAPGPAPLSDAALDAYLRRHCAHPRAGARAMVGQVAAMVGARELLLAMTTTEADAELRAYLSSLS